jgi:DNA-binding transcriptional LysR family regulator
MRFERLDLNLLVALDALIEDRNVSMAARRLYLSQPALTGALNRLRDFFGDDLLIPSGRQMMLTPKAEELRGPVREALMLIRTKITTPVAFDPASAERQFTIAPNSYVELALAPRIVARLGAVAPGIRLRLMPFGTDLAETGVISGTTALVLGRIVSPPDNLVVQHLMDEGLACVVRADHPEIGDSISREQFERMRHVNVLPPGRLRAGLFQAFQQQGVAREVAVSVTHFLAVPEMVAVTDYCATLPNLICRRLAGDPRLKILPAPVDLGTFPVEMAWHVRYRHDPAHRWLRALIADVAKEVAAEAAG